MCIIHLRANISFDYLQRKLKIEDETEFCSEDLLHTLLRCKVSQNFCYIFKSW